MLVVVLVVVVLLLLTIGFSGKLGTAGFTGSVSCFVGVEIGVWTFAGEFYVRNIWRFHQCDNQTQFFFFCTVRFIVSAFGFHFVFEKSCPFKTK